MASYLHQTELLHPLFVSLDALQPLQLIIGQLTRHRDLLKRSEQATLVDGYVGALQCQYQTRLCLAVAVI